MNDYPNELRDVSHDGWVDHNNMFVVICPILILHCIIYFKLGDRFVSMTNNFSTYINSMHPEKSKLGGCIFMILICYSHFSLKVTLLTQSYPMLIPRHANISLTSSLRIILSNEYCAASFACLLNRITLLFEYDQELWFGFLDGAKEESLFTVTSMLKQCLGLLLHVSSSYTDTTRMVWGPRPHLSSDDNDTPNDDKMKLMSFDRVAFFSIPQI